MQKNRKSFRGAAALLCIALSAALIVTGIMLGQPDSVMQKAAGICLECIGIG